MRSFYLWLEAEFAGEVRQRSFRELDPKSRVYQEAHVASRQRQCDCVITDETGLSDQEAGHVVATVCPDGDVLNASDVEIMNLRGARPNSNVSWG